MFFFLWLCRVEAIARRAGVCDARTVFQRCYKAGFRMQQILEPAKLEGVDELLLRIAQIMGYDHRTFPKVSSSLGGVSGHAGQQSIWPCSRGQAAAVCTRWNREQGVTDRLQFEWNGTARFSENTEFLPSHPGRTEVHNGPFIRTWPQ